MGLTVNVQRVKHIGMTKQQAIKLFGSGAALARAIGRTRSAISQWPKDLTQDQADLVTGAAVRLDKLSACGKASHPKPKRRTRTQ